MKKSCRYCGRTHQSGQVCKLKPLPKPRRKAGTKEVRFRNTNAWKRKRSEILERDYHLCKHCASLGRVTYEKLEVHHIAPLSERYDLRLEEGNLIALCSGCHYKADGGEIPRSLLRKLGKSKVPPLLIGRAKR